MSEELNQEQEYVQGDSGQESTPEVSESYSQEDTVAENVQSDDPTQSDIDRLLNNKKFMDAFYAQVGDGVKTIAENQVKRLIEKGEPVSQHNTDVKPVKSAPEDSRANNTGLEKPKETDVVPEYEERLRRLEERELNSAVRNIPQISELMQLDSTEANRFINRAISIARANSVQAEEISRIFSSESSIMKDINNQLYILKNRTQEDILPSNKPNKETVVNRQQPSPNKWSKIAQGFYKRQ